MGLFKIIKDRAVWDAYLNRFQDLDPYYTFEYGCISAKEEKGELRAAYYEKEDSKLFYPFIKRKVEWDEEPFFDIVTPYGYGGPLLSGNEAILPQFYVHFEEYCQENNIITETIRFHPLNKNYEKCGSIIDIEYIRKTTAVDLTLPLEEIRKQYSSMNKRNIKKAKNLGLFCFLAENSPQNIQTFIELYKETMNRNHANRYYYFDDDYFFKQLEKTNTSETFLLFAQYGNEIIAGVMVLIGTKYSHYHLGASRTKYLSFKPNNLLFDYMIESCKNKGSTLLHLGGGYEEEDGLFKFKTSFTNNNNYDYFIGKKVYDEKNYNRITEEIKKRYKVNDKYFPVYRGIKEILINS